MTSEQERAVYRLLRVPGIGSSAVGRVLTAWKDQPDLTGSFWGRPVGEYRSRWGLSERAARRLRDGDGSDETWRAGETDPTAAWTAQIELMAVLDGGYAALAAMRDLPPALFTRGNQDLLWDAGSAIAHSRGASEEALEWGAQLASALAEAGVGLITGHNRDGYRRAAAAAKRAGAPVVLALDRSLHGEPTEGPRAVPVATARLWDAQFRPERELVLSDAAPRETWTPAHSRRRDELIFKLATRVVAGAVRPGGIMADLCARAALTGQPVFRSPFCHVDLAATLLPVEIDAACAAVIDAEPEPRESNSSPRIPPSCPQPGWLERRWMAEAAAFVSALEAAAGCDGWVERRPANDAVMQGSRSKEILAAAFLPPIREEQEAELIVVGRRSLPTESAAGGDEAALVLSPGAKIADLQAFRAYLARCRARLEAALSIPRTSAAPASGPAPIPGSLPSRE